MKNLKNSQPKIPPGVDLRLIRYFVEVSKTLNFGRAADNLGMSQPPLSRAVRELEERISVQLFERDKRHVRLTNAGQAFLKDAQYLLDYVGRAVERAQLGAQGMVGQIDIAYFGSVVFGFLPEILAEFHDSYPDVKIKLHLMTKEQQVDAVANREIDIGFARHFTNHPDLAIVPVRDEELMFATPSNGDLAGVASVGLGQVAQLPLIVFPQHSRPSFADAVIQLLSQSDPLEQITPNVAHEMDDAAGCLAMVAAGQGNAVMPKSMTHFQSPAVTFIPFKAPAPTSSVSCIHIREQPSVPAQNLIALLRDGGIGGEIGGGIGG